jgi:hypothetical protein
MSDNGSCFIGESRIQSALTSLLGRDPPGFGGPAFVLDADRTLSTADTGRLVGSAFGLNDEIRAVFQREGYAAPSFEKVSEIWSCIPAELYLAQAEAVGAALELRSEWSKILSRAVPRVPVVVVCSGVPVAWRVALRSAGFPEIPVLGGCHPTADSYLVGPESKAQVVRSFQARGWRVLAAGDSLIDLPMLSTSDYPLIVPDSKGSMALRAAMRPNMKARQLIVEGQRFDDFVNWTPDDVMALIG